MRRRVHIWFIALFFAALVLPFPLFWLLQAGWILPTMKTAPSPHGRTWPRPRGVRKRPCLKICWATTRPSATSL